MESILYVGYPRLLYKVYGGCRGLQGSSTKGNMVNNTKNYYRHSEL